MARSLAVILTSVASLGLGTATATLLFILASSPAHVKPRLYTLPLVAAVLQSLSCCIRTILTVLRVCKKTKLSSQPVVERPTNANKVSLALQVLLSLVAAAVVGASLGWGEANIAGRGLLIAGLAPSTFLAITWVVWGVSLIAEVLHYMSIAWIHENSLKTSEQRFSIDDVPREMIEPSTPDIVKMPPSDLSHERLPSSTPSLIASDGTISVRSSISTIQRPSSSKRGLLSHQTFYTRSSSRSSWDSPSGRPSQDEAGFDSWDTSGVSSHIRETVFQAKPMKGSGLEPIPGSRSPSPAKALEGPFFQSSPSVTPPPSPLPQPSVSRPNSPPSSPLELPNWAAMFPPPASPSDSSPFTSHSFSRPGTRSGRVSRAGTVICSRPGSRSRAPSSEDHIHPLFRTSSPTPPPSASANTTVTAAPEAGQFINERMLKRMRSGSLPTSPSPLMRSESSPDIRAVKVPPSPNPDMAPTSPTIGSRPHLSHQRKRSASFSQLIIHD